LILKNTNSQNKTEKVDINPLNYKKLALSKYIRYYPYNCDDIDDYNWGCAW